MQRYFTRAPGRLSHQENLVELTKMVGYVMDVKVFRGTHMPTFPIFHLRGFPKFL